MAKWADYLISSASYNFERQIISLKRHKDFGDKIGPGEIIDKASVASHINNGISYMTIYGTLSNWKLGKRIRSFRVDNHYCLRIDDNKVKQDNLGTIPDLNSGILDESSKVVTKKIPDNLSHLQIPSQDIDMLKNMGAQQKGSIMSIETKSEKTTTSKVSESSIGKKPKEDILAEYEDDYLKRLENETTKKPSDIESIKSPHGTLPKGFDKSSATEKVEPVKTKQDEIPESPHGTLPKESKKITEKQKIEKIEIFDKQSQELNELEKQIGDLKKAVEKLDKSKKTSKKQSAGSSSNVQAYCVKCKSKRDINNPIQSELKNGRPAIKGTCSICGTRMSRLGKLK